MPARPDDVRAIFESVVDIESAADRAAYLERRCAADADLRREVESLLAAHQDAGDFLARSPLEALAPDRRDNGPPLLAPADNLRPMPQIQLRPPVTEPLTPVNQPDSPHMPAAPVPDAPGLQLLGEIARGGMGVVFKGRDTSLGRDVAVKVLLEAYRERAELAQRFNEEAQITGQLQHPGIVPVYQHGTFADRRPYFTMKLVKGQTLAALLAERKDPLEDQSRYLGIFTQVCHTLAYAHARGVIHRDLKPSNVMVGAHGEVQVMDWGLAKLLHQANKEDPDRTQRTQQVSEIRTARSAGSDAPESGSSTQAGTLLGTPAYMSPEQARGDIELIDERTDVFELGAMLCEILTGQPPFTGKNAEAARRARQGRVDDALARLDRCGADGELVALAKHCLAPEPWERPRHAGEVAEQMTAYQNTVAQRLRQAELARAAEEAQAKEALATAAQERKAREAAQAQAAAERRAWRLATALAVSLLLAVGLVGTAVSWWQRDRAQRSAEHARLASQTEGEVTAALEEAHSRGQEAGKLHNEPVRWEAALREALSAIKRAEGMLSAGVDDSGALTERVTALKTELEAEERDRRLVAALEQTRAQWAAAGKQNPLDRARAAELFARAFRQDDPAWDALAPEEAAARIRRRAVREQILSTLDVWAYCTSKKEEADRLRRIGEAVDADPNSFRRRCSKLIERQRWDDLLRLAFGAEAQEVSTTTLVGIAATIDRSGNTSEAVRFLKEAARRHPRDFWIAFELAEALAALNPPATDESIRYYTAACVLRPDSAVAHNNLGVALVNKGRTEEAVAEWRRAIELKPDLAPAHSNLAAAYNTLGRPDEAIEELRKAAQLKPGYADAGLNRSAVHVNLGIAHFQKGQSKQAIAEFRRAIELKPDYADAHFNFAVALHAMSRFDESIAAFRKAIELKPNYALAHFRLGSVLLHAGRADEALAEYREAIKLKPDFALAYCDLGLILRQQGQFAESLTAYRRGHELGSREPGWRNPSGQWVRDAEDFVRLDTELPKFLRGDPQPASPAERIRVARICQLKRLNATAARFYAEVFADTAAPQFVRNAVNRYNAAVAAALAGCGKGEDTDKLDEKERARLRRQAVGWLRDALALRTRQVAANKPGMRAQVQQVLRRWQVDPHVAGIRDKEALAKLPAEERAACAKAWADVAALLRTIEEESK